MRTLFTCLFFLTSLLSSYAQDIAPKFPEAYFGIYKGDLEIINSRGKQTIGMEFHLNKTDSISKYVYTLVYIVDGNRQERLYNLITKDKENGEYIVDENNGILLDAKLVDNTLYSMFEVQGSILTTKESFYEDYMTFEIIFARTEKNTSKEDSSENSIEVHSYPVSVVQKAVLKKQKI